jgi:hypothetical protein
MDGGFFPGLTDYLKKDAGGQVTSDITDDRTFDFIASTESVDRFKDVVVQDWDLADFQKNPVLLWSHQSGLPPIGTVEDFRVVPAPQLQMPGMNEMPMMSLARARMVPPGKYMLADLVAHFLKLKVIRAVSVGFTPGKNEERMLHGKWTGGFTYSQNKLIELSVVSVPANQDAVQLARSLGAGPLELRTIFTDPESAPAVPGISARVRRYRAELDLMRVRYGRSLGPSTHRATDGSSQREDCRAA